MYRLWVYQFLICTSSTYVKRMTLWTSTTFYKVLSQFINIYYTLLHSISMSLSIVHGFVVQASRGKWKKLETKKTKLLSYVQFIIDIWYFMVEVRVVLWLYLIFLYLISLLFAMILYDLCSILLYIYIHNQCDNLYFSEYVRSIETMLMDICTPPRKCC